MSAILVMAYSVKPAAAATFEQFGSPAADKALSSAVDSTGVYVVGSTQGSLDDVYAGGLFDAFIRKYSLDGATVLWADQIGTTGSEVAQDVAVDSTGVYVAGHTTGVLAPSNGTGTDVFVRKYSLDGTTIEWTVQFGTIGLDDSEAVAVDSTGVYVAGRTSLNLFGTNLGGLDSFIAKISLDGSTVLWGKQFGTVDSDFAHGLAVDSTGAYVAGSTSGDLEGVNAGLGGTLDAYVRKYSLDGNTTAFTLQFGTTNSDEALSVAVDSTGLYVAGYTFGQAFIREYTLDGTTLVWSDPFGPVAEVTTAYGLAVDSTGVYVSGTTSGDLEGTNAGLDDAFVRKYNLDGTPIEWTDQFGTNSSDTATGLAAGSGVVYGVGHTGGSLGGPNAGSIDVFLARFEATPTPPSATIEINGGAGFTNSPTVVVEVVCDDGVGVGCDTIDLAFANIDANISPIVQDQISIDVYSDTNATPKTLLARETSDNTAIFVLDIVLTVTGGGDTIEFTEGDTITATGTFFDSADGPKTIDATFTDFDGNFSLESDIIILDADLDLMPPTGPIIINSGAATTFDPDVDIELTCDDGLLGTGCSFVMMTFNDTGKNTNPSASETVTGITVFSDSDAGGALFTAFELGLDSDLFQMNFSLLAGPSIPGVGVQYAPGDTITAEYAYSLPHGVKTASVRFFDLGGNLATPIVDTINFIAVPDVTILALSNDTPKWGVDTVNVDGIYSGASLGDCVRVQWGDSTVDLVPISPGSGAWAAAGHTYPPVIAQDNLFAELINPCVISGGTVIATSVTTVIDVQPQDTVFLLNDIGTPATDTALTVSGILLSADTGQQLPEGQTITFTGFGASGLPASVTTGGITISDPLGGTIVACPAPATCIPDLEGADSNMVLRLSPGGMLTFPSGTQSVNLEIQDSGIDQFTFEVTEVGNSPFITESFGAYPDQVSLFISAPNGIASVELLSITGSGTTAGISSILTSNPLNTPQEMIRADLENLGDGTYGTSLTLESGSFFAHATAVNVADTGLDVQAHYPGNPPFGLYAASDGATQLYDVEDRSWGAAGDPTSFTVDSGTGINTIKCATDADGDGLCSGWDNSGVIAYAGSNFDLCSIECPEGEDHKDLYVEIDWMDNHNILDSAIASVKAAFDTVPNGDLPLPANTASSVTPGTSGTINGITLHVQEDPVSLGHGFDLVKVWKDSTANNNQDDFEDIKANNFGIAGERSGGLLATNNVLKAKAEVFHYGISVHGIGGACNAATPSGIGETPGNDFVISLGCQFIETNSGHSGTEGDQTQQAGTLMHELGHNLNLDHGGPKEFRELPSDNSLLGSATYAVTDGASGDSTRTFTVTGLQVETNQARTGTVLIPINLPFTGTPTSVTVSGVSFSGDGSAIVINTVTSYISGTGTTRLVTLVVKWTTSVASDAGTGNLGTFTVNLNVAPTSLVLNTPTSPAVGANLKIAISTTDSGMNCKVNRESVMSYTRQFATYLTEGFYSLDYSRRALPLVDEALTNAESNFFSGITAKLVNAFSGGYFVSTAPNVDWNGNNAISGSSKQDSNNFGITGCGAAANQKQRGYDDWRNIQLDFKEGIGSFDGTYSDPRQDQEITGGIIDEIIVQVDDSTTTTTATPPGGSYGSPQSVTLMADGPATIYYTTDGSPPDENSNLYSGPIAIATTTTLKFFSISDASGNPEMMKTEEYTIEAELFCGRPITDYNVIDGTSGNNNLAGTAGRDLIRGFGGHDIINGKGGDDCLMGGPDNDIILGGAGNDELHGEAGVDGLNGGAGNDKLFGGDGWDAMNGGTGNDTLSGGEGNDAMEGWDGNDQINGDSGTDAADGGKGTDSCDAENEIRCES